MDDQPILGVMKNAGPPISSASNDSDPAWYVVCCKPRQESVAEENLKRQGFDVYLPRMRSRLRKRDRWVDGIQILFPRYLFIRVDRRRQSTASIRSTRGAVGLVKFGIDPAVVPSGVIDAILAREDVETGLHYVRPTFRPGERVVLREGPFAGIEGVFASEDGDERATLLIELLGKANRVRVDRDWIVRAA